MLIYQSEDLESQGLMNSNTSELILQGKKLFKSISISKRFRQAAIDMCQKELDSGRFCVLVEIPTFFTLWKQKLEFNPIIEKTSVETFSAETSETTSETTPETTPETTLETTPAKLTTEFLNLCKQQLNKIVGPIAEYIMDDIMEANPDITPQQLVLLISNEIPNSSQSQQFKETLLSLI